MDQRNRKSARPAGGTAERAEETGSASRADTTSKNYCTSDQDRTQAGYISQFLLPGAGQGLHLRDLVRITQRSERDVRKQIHIERRRHIPILSNNLDGYYLPSSKEEKDRCVDSLRRRAAEILEAADAIEKAEV